jgi:glycosyltransferase involved in cell wall biosynthesis
MDVTVFCPPNDNPVPDYNGVKLKYLNVSKDTAPMKYYIQSVSKAVKDNFDIVLMCGQGGYAYIPQLLKRHKPIFITNTDGIEHRRTKWNKIVRLGVRFVGEMTSVITSDYLVADSKGIKAYLEKEYSVFPKKIYTIEYGAEVLNKDDYSEDLIEEYGVKPGEYYLVVSRLEPENNVSMILEGYKQSKTDKPLVVVGNLKESTYVEELKALSQNSNIKLVGGVYKPAKLKALRLNCAAYLHGHSVGGTNPSLLEALGAGNIVIGHDNPFNREVTDNVGFYFNNPQECATAIDSVDMLTETERKQYANHAVNRIINYYNWDRIADEYTNMFNQVYKNKSK